MSKLLKAIAAFKPIANNPVVKFLVGCPLAVCVMQSSEYFYNNGLIFLGKTSLTLSIFIVYYFIYLSIINQMSDKIYSFHKEKNSANLHKNPVKFAFKHKNKINLFYKSFFFIAALYILIVIWIIK
ncbi:hypothetical protein AB1E22_07990 [Buttiauxella gaviniae]|uniref:DUF3899 domain-containing protein n=1 Tax=Buttiauxella gaviniae TaxID=82990 RepID=A0ABV3NSZ2_9ENTR